jgi:hypothetical protein
MIQMKINRPDGKSFIAYFKTVEDVKNFEGFIAELIANVKTKTIEEMGKKA